VRLLNRLWPRPERVEVDELAVVLGLVPGPDRLHRLDPLAHQRKPRPGVRAVRLHLLPVPAGADAEQEAPAGDPVDRRHLLGGDDRVALDDQTDPGGERQPLGHGRDRPERHEGVVHVAVLARQLAAGRVRRPARSRDVRVLGHEQRLEPVLLDDPPELVRLDRVVRREHHQADVHGPALWRRSPCHAAPGCVA
jgi:hypothetical protein